MSELKIIARIHTDFPEKFGIPRQSMLIDELEGKIIFEPAYRTMDAVKGLEGFDYIWLLWAFEGTDRKNWSATVTPPRLGGKEHVGVFATRSPFRPNPIGLSGVRLVGIEESDQGPVLYVRGADLRDGTPIYDIKPYLAYADAHPDAREGFAGAKKEDALLVDFPDSLLEKLPKEKRESAIKVLAQDPRPRSQMDEGRLFGLAFAGMDIRFVVEQKTVIVKQVVPYGTKIH